MPSVFRSLNSHQRHAFAACFLGWSLDAFDFFILVFCVSSIAGDFHVQPSAVAEALFFTLAFRPVGAFLFGALADKYGRRPALMLNIACYSIFELACAFVTSLHGLYLLRALFGIAMGGEWGVGAALAFETLPKEGRGFFSGLLQEGYVVGYLVAAAAYALLFPHFAHMMWHGYIVGWRGMFIVGAIPALLVFYIGFKVEESPVWRERNARATAPQAASTEPKTGVLAGIRQYAPTFLFLILLMTGFNALSHGTQDLYPTFLQKDHHFSAGLTGAVAIVYNVGALLGGIFFGALSEKFGRKRTIIAAALLSLPMIPLYAFSHSLYALAGGAFLMQFMVQGAWGVVPAYLSELSPGPVRATFPGLAYQLGNLITSRNSVIQAKAAERFGGYGRVLAVTVLIVACFLAIITAFGRESRGADLTV
ncbi:SHS family lactate transporter-like MFS transporter [Silvibacterium bohemicum]|uniref:SHS family lactate transporter-like MFS transporter n=1 Tax=Silvibacterium bohemicum TaxID=1577686 RepID=A0A841JPE9_9BACT|nr:MFS transporter [Silvibacterium bohemicum]MBB6142457.1 SHS family lactate transporter-like MFS transporter [Silvibacterium bohemicum]